MSRVNTNNTIFKQAFLFIDGNNMINRFQEILFLKLKKENINESLYFNDLELSGLKDSFQWTRNKFIWQGKSLNNLTDLLKHNKIEIIRGYYYTYCDNNNQKSLSDLISETPINISSNPLTLTPEIITRSKGEQAKGDDIKICIDSIKHASNGSADIIYLFTGDGDFLPLIEELQSMGKYVFVAAFDYEGKDDDYKKACGLNPKLKQRADYFFNLSSVFGLPYKDN